MRVKGATFSKGLLVSKWRRATSRTKHDTTVTKWRDLDEWKNRLIVASPIEQMACHVMYAIQTLVIPSRLRLDALASMVPLSTALWQLLDGNEESDNLLCGWYQSMFNSFSLLCQLLFVLLCIPRVRKNAVVYYRSKNAKAEKRLYNQF